MYLHIAGRIENELGNNGGPIRKMVRIWNACTESRWYTKAPIYTVAQIEHGDRTNKKFHYKMEAKLKKE